MPKEKHWNGIFDSKEDDYVPKHTNTKCRYCGKYGQKICPTCELELYSMVRVGT